MESKQVMEKAIKNVIRRFDLQDIDLDQEVEKINKKESNLSKKRREAVLALHSYFTEQDIKEKCAEIKRIVEG